MAAQKRSAKKKNVSKRNTSKRKVSNKRKNKVSFITILKRRVFFLIILFLIYGIAVNSSEFKSYKETAYSSLKEEYIKKEEKVDTIEENTEVIVKNLCLTVDQDLRVPSNATVEDINKMLKGTNLEGLGEAFVEAEEQHRVNSLYMVGLACLESGYGTSSFAINRNNLYGWNAVDSNPDKATSFNSKKDATLFVAKMLKKNYLTVGGAYHEGFSARSIDVHYCTDKQHADKIVSIVSELIKKLG